MAKQKTKNALIDSQVSAGSLLVGDNITINYFANQPFSLSATKQFFDKVSPELLEQTIPIFDVHQLAIDDFFKSQEKRILLIIGSGETGKTHLLRNLILLANEKSWQTYGIESSGLGLQIPPLPSNTPILLFKDDVDWEKDGFLLPILQFIDSNPNLRLVLTVHSSWEKRIIGIIQDIKDLPGKVQSLELELWKHEHLVSLLRLSAKTSEVKHEEDIAKQFANPYLLKYFGESMSGNPKITVEAISQNYAVKVRRVFEQNLQPDLGVDKVQTFIFYLSFNRVHDHLLDDFAQIIGIEHGKLQVVLERLKRTGMIRHRFGGWFISPEVKGDFYIASELENKYESEIKLLLLPFLDQQTKWVIKKVIEVARFVTYHSRKILASFLSHQLKEWEHQIRENPAKLERKHIWVATEVLQMEKDYGIETATDAACALVIYSFNMQIKTRDASVLNDNILTLPASNAPKGEEYGRFLEVLVHLKRKRPDYLLMLQELWLSGWKTNISNYQPETLLTNAFKPFDKYNNIESYKIGLQYASTWLQQNNRDLRNMAVKALQTMLGAFFEYIKNEYTSLIFGATILPNDRLLFQLREEAIDIILEAMQHEEYRLYCLRILDDIGQGQRFHGFEDLIKIPAFLQIQKEIERCIPAIGAILCDNQDFLIQKTAESTLLKWWLWGISDSMEHWLLKFERTPEYLLYRHTIDNVYMTEDFARMMAKAPFRKRLDWFWKHSDLKEMRSLGSVEQYKKLVKHLSKNYKTPDKIAQFIQESILKISVWEKTEGRSNSMTQLTRIIQCWALVMPKHFKTLLESPELSNSFPEKMRSEIQTQLLASGQYQPNEIATPLLARIPSLTPAEMSQLVFLIQKYQPAQKVEWLMKMIEEGQEPMLHEIAYRLNHIFKGDTEVSNIADSLLRILNSGKITNEGFFGRDFSANHAYEYLFQHLDRIPSELDEQLRNETFHWLKKVSTLDASEKDALQYCIRETDHLIELLDFRATHITIENFLQKSDFKVGAVFLEGVFSSEELFGIFKTPENHRRFVDRIGGWESAALDSTSWKNPYLDIVDPDTKKPWIIGHLQHALEQNDLEAVKNICQHIPRNEIHIDLMIQAWQQLLRTENDDFMESMLYHWTTYNRGSSGIYSTNHNRYDLPKAFWAQVSNRLFLDLRLKMLVQKVKIDLENHWSKQIE